MSHAVFRFASVLLAICLCGNSAAQNSPTSDTPAIFQPFQGECQKLLPQRGINPTFDSVLSDRPTDPALVCNCAERKYLSDPRLKRYMPLTDSALTVLPERERLKQYLTVRYYSAFTECLASELNLSLLEFRLPE